MNNKHLDAAQSIPIIKRDTRRTALLRSVLVKVLEKAAEGHFLLKENGRVITEVGNPDAELKRKSMSSIAGHTRERCLEEIPLPERPSLMAGGLLQILLKSLDFSQEI